MANDLIGNISKAGEFLKDGKITQAQYDTIIEQLINDDKPPPNAQTEFVTSPNPAAILGNLPKGSQNTSTRITQKNKSGGCLSTVIVLIASVIVTLFSVSYLSKDSNKSSNFNEHTKAKTKYQRKHACTTSNYQRARGATKLLFGTKTIQNYDAAPIFGILVSDDYWHKLNANDKIDFIETISCSIAGAGKVILYSLHLASTGKLVAEMGRTGPKLK